MGFTFVTTRYFWYFRPLSALIVRSRHLDSLASDELSREDEKKTGRKRDEKGRIIKKTNRSLPVLDWTTIHKKVKVNSNSSAVPLEQRIIRR